MRHLPLAATASALLVGCLTHMKPPEDHAQMKVAWSADFTEALGRATLERKPIMAVLAAGELDGLC